MITTGVGKQEFTEENQKEKRLELEKTIEKKDFMTIYTIKIKPINHTSPYRKRMIYGSVML